jgi:hypothetical protein
VTFRGRAVFEALDRGLDGDEAGDALVTFVVGSRFDAVFVGSLGRFIGSSAVGRRVPDPVEPWTARRERE